MRAENEKYKTTVLRTISFFRNGEEDIEKRESRLFNDEYEYKITEMIDFLLFTVDLDADLCIDRADHIKKLTRLFSNRKYKRMVKTLIRILSNNIDEFIDDY